MAKKTTARNVMKKASGSKATAKAGAKPAGKAAGSVSKVFKAPKLSKTPKFAVVPNKAPGKGFGNGVGKRAAAATPATPAKRPAPVKLAALPAKRAVAKVGGKGAVVPVGSGSGPSPAEVGRDFVALFNARTPDHEIWDKLFSPEFVSVEGHGASMAFHGRDAVQAKCDQWLEMSTVHGCACEGPFVGATCFAVKFRIDKTDKATGRRAVIEEIAVYAVQDGRVVREEFCYFIG